METPKEKLHDIYLDLNIRRFANRYFGKSSSWLYHKFDQIDTNGNGLHANFNPEELNTLKAGLYDFAERIKAAADKL